MSQKISLLTLAIVATAVVVGERFVQGGATATAAGRASGVAATGAAIGETFPVDALGTAIVVASDVIAVNAAIEVAADGKAVTKSAGVTVARALQAATAAGDRIEVLLIPN